MAWFAISDWHLNHGNIIKYCQRPFVNETESELLAMADRGTIPGRELRISPESVKLMTDTIIDSTNAVVGPNDTLVHAGDLMFSSRDELLNKLREYRKRLLCKNIILVWGNHDDSLFDLYHNTGRYHGPQWTKASQEVRSMFVGAYDQFMFNVNGQKIFINHYPMRSWDCAHHGAWMLYGHVHDLFHNEDNGNLGKYAEHVLAESFQKILSCSKETLNELLDAVANLNGIDLTVDIGVDNRVRGPLIPFGTPWSMNDLYSYMGTKKAKWDSRGAKLRGISAKSTLKGDAETAHPKF
jgi:calcineurin-like phosphoesterase family protein